MSLGLEPRLNNPESANVKLITARKRSLGQGNTFTGVCLSTWGVPDQVHPPGADMPPGADPPRPGTTPQDQVHPPGPGTPPMSRHPPRVDTPQEQTPSGADTPRSRPPSPQDQVPPKTRYPPRPGTPPKTRYPPRPGTPPKTRYTPQDQVHPPNDYCCGRYASYWNAFLLVTNMIFKDEVYICRLNYCNFWLIVAEL